MLISEEAIMQTENEKSRSPHAVTKPQPCHRATDFSIDAIMAKEIPLASKPRTNSCTRLSGEYQFIIFTIGLFTLYRSWKKKKKNFLF